MTVKRGLLREHQLSVCVELLATAESVRVGAFMFKGGTPGELSAITDEISNVRWGAGHQG